MGHDEYTVKQVVEGAVQHVHLDTYDEVQDFFRSTQQRWQDKQFAFRGHADADWRLVPSIMRDSRWGQYLHPRTREGIHLLPADIATALEQHAGSEVDPFALVDARQVLAVLAETELLWRFMRRCDEASVRIPGDHPLLRSSLHVRIHGEDPETRRTWPPDSALWPLTLAQHCGVPTRLLDWTRDWRVAAYFTCRNASSNPSSGRRAVWALNVAAIHAFWTESVSDSQVIDESPVVGLQVLSAPTHDNLYLGAQKGLFSVDREWPEKPLEHRIRDRLITICGQIAEGKKVPGRISFGGLASVASYLPALVCCTFPASEAPRALRLLSHDGYNAATLFPDASGVARSLDEEALWDERSHFQIYERPV